MLSFRYTSKPALGISDCVAFDLLHCQGAVEIAKVVKALVDQYNICGHCFFDA